jgi:hypothetical protein
MQLMTAIGKASWLKNQMSACKTQMTSSNGTASLGIHSTTKAPLHTMDQQNHRENLKLGV